MSRPIRVAILGASGYGAAELLRLFTQHSGVEVVSLISTSGAGEPVERVHPHLRGFYNLVLSEKIDTGRLLGGEHALVFSALPHGASGRAIAALIDSVGDPRLRIIDLSGDLRLSSVDRHRRHYPESADLPDHRRQFVYGLPELNRAAIQKARWIANPGCLATAAILAGAPLMTAGFHGSVAIDAMTGSSGAGRTLKETTHHPTRHADFRAYKALAHQHEPEILQAWGDPGGERIWTAFVAHSLPAVRGIFVTLHATLPEPETTEVLTERYRAFYAGCPFVRVVPDSPSLQDVAGSNFCDVSLIARGGQVVALAALDNLVKGMAGAAVQNMNLMCGLPETTGLWSPALRPI